MDSNRDIEWHPGWPDEAFALLEESELAAWKKLASIEACNEHDIASSGYTVHTLEAAAWSFLTTESYEEAIVRAANLGDDADTVAAVCGASLVRTTDTLPSLADGETNCRTRCEFARSH